MWNTDTPSLPDWIQEAYKCLEPQFENGTEEISRTEAHEILLSQAEYIEESSDARYALDRLLDRGWLYEVNETLRKTD